MKCTYWMLLYERWPLSRNPSILNKSLITDVYFQLKDIGWSLSLFHLPTSVLLFFHLDSGGACVAEEVHIASCCHVYDQLEASCCEVLGRECFSSVGRIVGSHHCTHQLFWELVLNSCYLQHCIEQVLNAVEKSMRTTVGCLPSACRQKVYPPSPSKWFRLPFLALYRLC